MKIPPWTLLVSSPTNVDVPLLVYHSISEHYEFASDRHHLFMLQGARDVQANFRESGISYAFHLATPSDRKPHLVDLAKSASVVITEDMPVNPPLRFLKALHRQTTTPIACVDTACIVPMQLVKKPYTRAFKFREATAGLYEERLHRMWPKLDLVSDRSFNLPLNFTSLDLQGADFAKLIAACDIDHSVGPVCDTVGGSKAGYERWEQFKKTSLRLYHKQRNDALVDGVSRMSPYLRYGMVSPMRLAREATAIANPGSEKYLDELLIWREMAYSFCRYREDHDQWSAIPDWARQSLNSHASDRRDHLYSWEQLARGQTEDDFWNLAQRSLLMHGELHNNVRMTWGKALLNWVQCPEKTLQLLIDLNHGYALDGRDPASYGGLLWCLGQFDRPFTPEKKIYGSIRTRSTRDHGKRLDLTRYSQKILTPRFSPVPKVAVIGAGISGLFAARTLSDHGLDVEVFDKGRGVGGRMSTRRVDGESAFDHGAQYFTVRDARFQKYVDAWQQQGLVARWPDQTEHPHHRFVVFDKGERTEKTDSNIRYVGIPAMNSICKHLATDLTIHKSTRIKAVESTGINIQLIAENGKHLGEFDRLIVSAPAAQAAELLENFPKLAQPISNIQMQPCWAVMAILANPLTDDWAGAFVHHSIVTWAARNGTKPSRPEGEHLLLHADHEWTSAKLGM